MAMLRASKTLFFCAMVVTFWAPVAFAVEFAGGNGEPNDPYQIATAEQLISISLDTNLFDKHSMLVNDIDLYPNLPSGHTFIQVLIASNLDSNSKRNFPLSELTNSFAGNS